MTVVAFCDDLMDRSRLAPAVADVVFAREPGAAAGATVVVVDLARYGARLAEIRAAAPAARIVAFGSHVDRDALGGAEAAGADAVLPRSRFFQDPAAALTLAP